MKNIYEYWEKFPEICNKYLTKYIDETIYLKTIKKYSSECDLPIFKDKLHNKLTNYLHCSPCNVGGIVRSFYIKEGPLTSSFVINNQKYQFAITTLSDEDIFKYKIGLEPLYPFENIIKQFVSNIENDIKINVKTYNENEKYILNIEGKTLSNKYGDLGIQISNRYLPTELIITRWGKAILYIIACLYDIEKIME